MSVPWKAVTSVAARCNDSTPPPPPPFITDPIVPCDPLQHRLHHPLHRGDDTRGGYKPLHAPLSHPGFVFLASPAAEANLQLSACVSAPANPRRRGEAEVDYTDKVAYVIK